MSKDKSKRTFESPLTHNSQVRLESLRPATQGRVHPSANARMTPQQRQALVLRLIDFFKSA